VLSYIALVAVLNVSLGFGMAVYLGHRYRSAIAEREMWAAMNLPALSDSNALTGEELREADESQPAAEGQQQKSESKAAVELLEAEVNRYNDRLVEADGELRPLEEEPDAAAIEECLNSLLAATEEYLDSRNDAHQDFDALHREKPEFDRLRGQLQEVVVRENEQIENTNEAIQVFNYEGDLPQGVREMVGETGKLLDANRQVQNTVEEAAIKVAEHEKPPAESDEAADRDGLTKICSRDELEARLLRWWRNDAKRARELSLAMVDVDRFTQVDQQYGRKVGDQILQAIVRLLEGENGGKGHVARFSAQRFVFMFPDAGARQATNIVERIRQTMEISRFKLKDSDIQITVSCAVSRSNKDDTLETLFTRLESTLQEAKRYGRNRTFLYEGSYPTPVVPPNFALEEKQISL